MECRATGQQGVTRHGAARNRFGPVYMYPDVFGSATFPLGYGFLPQASGEFGSDSRYKRYVWTGKFLTPERKKLLIQKFQNTCAQGLIISIACQSVTPRIVEWSNKLITNSPSLNFIMTAVVFGYLVLINMNFHDFFFSITSFRLRRL